MAAVVLGQIDLNNKIVTADALHTVKATANHIHEHGGEFVLPVKENRQALFDAPSLAGSRWSSMVIFRHLRLSRNRDETGARSVLQL